MKYNGLIVAFDFDNTIYDTHDNGYDLSEVIKLLKKCSKIKGFTMILFTVEYEQEKIDKKKRYCEELGIRVDYINESPIYTEAKKPYYNILLDDRAGLLEAFDNLSFVVDCIKMNDVSQNITNTVINDGKLKNPDDYVKGYKAGVKDGYDDALLKLQESNPNTEIPSTETLFKIFDLLFAADKRMKDTSSCYMNTYQYYVNSIVKHWNDENKSITQNEDDYM
jgi:hypothetical protein